jgi:hypothetical protein
LGPDGTEDAGARADHGFLRAGGGRSVAPAWTPIRVQRRPAPTLGTTATAPSTPANRNRETRN